MIIVYAFSEWSEWSKCSEECGLQTTFQTRNCIDKNDNDCVVDVSKCVSGQVNPKLIRNEEDCKDIKVECALIKKILKFIEKNIYRKTYFSNGMSSFGDLGRFFETA
jgi:hypothetical protein